MAACGRVRGTTPGAPRVRGTGLCNAAHRLRRSHAGADTRILRVPCDRGGAPRGDQRKAHGARPAGPLMEAHANGRIAKCSHDFRERLGETVVLAAATDSSDTECAVRTGSIVRQSRQQVGTGNSVPDAVHLSRMGQKP